MLSGIFGRKKPALTGKETIERLRKEPFNVETERKLEAHPYVQAAESGSLTLRQKQAFACEQYSIQRSDAISFACLAGHSNFRPDSLTGIETPSGNNEDLFQFLLSGEIYASSLLLKYAKSVDIESEAALKDYKCSSLAQAYPSYWARLALGNHRAAGAAACAVNFPAWGRMCARLAAVLNVDEEGLGFIKFFASPIQNLDEMAAAVIDAEGAQYEDIVEHVRLLQEYEVLFWDAILDAK